MSMWKLPLEEMLTSELQEKILCHICTTSNADYKTISKETDRDRITILQSLQPLFRRRYVRKERLVPEYEKSKLIFIPTQKGIIYALCFLELDFKLIPESFRKGPQISKLLQVIELFPDRYHIPFAKGYAGSVLEGSNVDPFNKNGEFMGIPQHRNSRLVREFLVEYVVSSAEHKEKIDITKDVEPLKRIYSKDELKKTQELLSDVSGKLQLISEQFQI